MDDLRRCPFCGHKARVITELKENDFEVLRCFAYVQCNVCEVKTKEFEVDKSEEDYAIEMAIDAWNVRYADRGDGESE